MAASTRGWSIDSLISKAPDTFRHADRISAKLSSADLNSKIREYERNGRPLVIEGFHDLDIWPKEELNLDRFVERSAEDTVSVRNVHTWTDSEVKLTEFVEKSRTMGPYVQENETERWYGKDMECPKAWEEWLHNGGVVPTMLLGSGHHDLFRYRPESAPVQTLMCYLGIGDTFTPCHKDLCASSGQNLMCYTENNGSSFWFMTSSSTAPKASKYFQDLLQELDHENHVVTVEELAKAPFEVYVLEQKLGDLVLVPPRSCHQVVNSGGITIKTSWSRMTLNGLITAYYHELPIYRRVCRPEIYKVKSTIFHTIIGQTREVQKLKSKKAYLSPPSSAGPSNRMDNDSNEDSALEVLINSLKQLIPVADAILSEEYDKMGETMLKTYSGQNRFAEESFLSCDFCGGDIFQSFFECVACVEGGVNGVDRLHMCPGCYVEGRTCACSKLQPQQYGKFQDLIDVREKAVKAVCSYERLHGNTFTAELKLRNENLPQLFRAACRLYTHRLQPQSFSKIQKGRVCTSKDKHAMPHDAGLNCKGCHHSKCFTHILECHKVHAADALLLAASDKTPNHLRYHANHVSKSTAYKDRLPTLELNQIQGTRHTGYSQLVFNALNYSRCVPVRHAQYLRAGWYDNHEFMDNEGSTSVDGPDEETTTTRDSTPLFSDKPHPTLKIIIPAMKAHPPTVISNLSTPLSSLPSTSGNVLDQTDIPMTPTSVDSDDLPLTHPSFTVNHSRQITEPSIENNPDYAIPPARPVVDHPDSDSEDARMVDSLIRAATIESSQLEDDEHEIDRPQTKKRMIPYVLVPRLTEEMRRKYNHKGSPYVLVPPAPHSTTTNKRKYQATDDSEASASSSAEQKAGSEDQSASSTPKFNGSTSMKLKSVSSEKKEVAGVAKAMNAASSSSSLLPKKRKSDTLTKTSTKTTPSKKTGATMSTKTPAITTTTPSSSKITSAKTSPPRPRKNFKLKSGIRIFPPPRLILPQQQQTTTPAQKGTPVPLASIKKNAESIKKMARIGKTPLHARADADAQRVPSTSTSGSGSGSGPSSSSSPSNPFHILQQRQQDAIKQLEAQALAGSSSMNQGNIQQVAIRAITEIVSIATANSASQMLNVQQQQQQQQQQEQQNNVSAMAPFNGPENFNSGMHPTQGLPTEHRMTRYQLQQQQQQQAAGQYPPPPDVPWRAGVSEQYQYTNQGFYARSSYGRYSDVRPYQNHQSYAGRHAMHPYFNYQRQRHGFQQFQQTMGGSSSRPNFRYVDQRYHHHHHHHQQQSGSGSGFAQRNPGSVRSPPREPRRHRPFQSEFGWPQHTGKGKGKARMPEHWERNEMERDHISTSSSLFHRMEPHSPHDDDLPSQHRRRSSYDYDHSYSSQQYSTSCVIPSGTDTSPSPPRPTRLSSRFGPTLDQHRRQTRMHDRDGDTTRSSSPSLGMQRHSRSRTSSQDGREDSDEVCTPPPPRPRHRENWNGGASSSRMERGGRGDERIEEDDVYPDPRTPTFGLVTLPDEESAPTFPESDLVRVTSGATTSRPSGSRRAADVDVLEMEVDDGDNIGGGGEGRGDGSGHWEVEEDTEEEKEKEALGKASWRHEDEEDSPRVFEEEEGSGEEEARRQPVLRASQGGHVIPNQEEDEENTSQIWEDNYAMEEDEEGLFGVSLRTAAAAVMASDVTTPLFLRVESDDDGVDEVSLGVEGD